MFSFLKEKVLMKAFDLVFMRYDYGNKGALNVNELTSLINDVFQLLRVPKQISYFQAGFIMKVFDSDGNAVISKQEAYDSLLNALSKFGGISGIAKMAGFGKTSSGVPHGPNDPNANIAVDDMGQVEYKISGKVAFNPPEDIDESMLAKLPPPGQNLTHEDKVKAGQNTETKPVNKAELDPEAYHKKKMAQQSKKKKHYEDEQDQVI